MQLRLEAFQLLRWTRPDQLGLAAFVNYLSEGDNSLKRGFANYKEVS